jgi:putative membrane protein
MNRSGTTKPNGLPAVLILSGLVLALIAFLYLGPKFIGPGNLTKGTLPKLNAWLNGSCALVLFAGWRAIRRQDVVVHRRLMALAVGLSGAFLVSYVVQHGSFPSVKYGGTAPWAYYPVLLTHIVLAAAIVPLVLLTLYRALTRDLVRHRNLARWTLPLWLYVNLSGVAVYLFCAPYY